MKPQKCTNCGHYETHDLYESDKKGTFKKKRWVGWVCDSCSYVPLTQESDVNWDLIWEND